MLAAGYCVPVVFKVGSQFLGGLPMCAYSICHVAGAYEVVVREQVVLVVRVEGED